MAIGDEISAERLREALRYEADTGKLFWLNRPREHFRNGFQFRRWNTRFAGAEAFYTKHGKGYFMGSIDDQKILAHRVIWCLTSGAWPTHQIDHINGDKSDNRLANLREATVSENGRNCPRLARNTSGVCGVSWKTKIGKWVASIKSEGRLHFLGYHSDFDDAVAARKQAERRLGFHENHGREAA